MPSLSFKTRFAEGVAQGSKRHTIRAWRKRPFRAGDKLSFFTGMRTKNCRRLRADAVCRSAVRIEIDAEKKTVVLDGNRLSSRQVARLARKDGFAGVESFWGFFAETHGRFLRGQMLGW